MTAGRQSVSATKTWNTPADIAASVRAAFGGQIELDPCSNEHSIVGAQREYRLPETDGLQAPWDAKTIFVNPPYGSDPQRGTRIIHWFQRISMAASQGSEVIALVPVATNTKHWKDHVFPEASSICFLAQPRLRFLIEGEGAPMACAVIYWGDHSDRFATAFQSHGAVVSLEGVVVP